MKWHKFSFSFMLALAICLLPVPSAFALADGEAQVGTAQEFVDAVHDEDVSTITLTQDIDLSRQGVLDVDGMTIDLDGNTISADNFTTFFQGCDFTVQDGELDSKGGSYALWIGDAGATDNVLIQDVDTTGGINVYNASNVTLENVNATGTNYYAVWCDYGAQVTIESGTYQSDGAAVLGEDNAGQLIIKGGEFIVKENQGLIYGTSGGSPQEGSGDFKIYGGTFNVELNDAWLADGVEVVLVDGKYVVREAAPPVSTASVQSAATISAQETVAVSQQALTAKLEAQADGSDTVSLADNQGAVIRFSLPAGAASDSALRIISVSVNGVELDYSIAEDGSILLSPEALAALGVGTHVIHVQTTLGLVKVTITINSEV